MRTAGRTLALAEKDEKTACITAGVNYICKGKINFKYIGLFDRLIVFALEFLNYYTRNVHVTLKHPKNVGKLTVYVELSAANTVSPLKYCQYGKKNKYC